MTILAVQPIEGQILLIRGHRVMLDVDLARAYGVPTKRLNQQVSRNIERFPEDFMFRLTQAEKEEVVAKCNHLRLLRFASSPPCAFTEHGALMLASVLKSPAAVRASIEVVRAFVRLRELLVGNRKLSRRLDELERRYDGKFKVVFDAIRALTGPAVKARRQVGFRPERD